MKLIVTGALGHIGSRLVRDLPRRFPGISITMIDNLSTQRYASLFNLPEGTHYRFIEGDVTSMDLHPVLDGADAMVHLAAITDAAGSFEKRVEVERNNFEATRRVAEACLSLGVRLLIPSSTSVYGTQATQVDEDCSIEELKPQSPYAETKLREEALVTGLVAEKGLRGIVCRFGTIYGISPGMRFHTAVNKFCWQAVQGQSLTVWRTAYEQMRPYLDLDDAVRAVAFFLSRDLFDGRIYNVVSANHTVRNVIDTIRSQIGHLNVSFVDERIMNQLSYEVLNTRLLKAGFTPSGNLERGIADTLNLLRGMNAHQSTTSRSQA